MTLLRDVIAKAICKSGRFETGEGTCALVCLDQLGDARRDCPHAAKVHHKFVALIETAIRRELEPRVQALSDLVQQDDDFEDWRNNGDSK
jgi:hypothetical protein